MFIASVILFVGLVSIGVAMCISRRFENFMFRLVGADYVVWRGYGPKGNFYVATAKHVYQRGHKWNVWYNVGGGYLVGRMKYLWLSDIYDNYQNLQNFKDPRAKLPEGIDLEKGTVDRRKL